MAYTYSRSITIDHTKCGATDSSNFPFLFSTTDATFKTVGNGGHVQNANGYDMAFFSDSGLTTPLNFEIERYNGSTGEYDAWIKAGTVSHTVDTVIYQGYGDASITTSQENITGTWDANFLAVYHLKDGTTLSAASSTGSNNGTASNTPTAGAGQIDGCGSFASASSQSITLGTGMAPTAVTMEAWVNATSLPNAYNTAIARDGVSNFWAIYVKSTGKLAIYVTATGNVSYDGTGSHTLSTGTWTYLAGTYSTGAGLVGYFNNASDQTAAANGTLTTGAVATSIANDPANAGRFWNGLIDEVRISNVARGVDWLLTSYNSQKSPSTFYTLGAESGGGGGGSKLKLNSSLNGLGASGPFFADRLAA